MASLSIIMPVYNEAATLRHALDRVLGVEFPCPVELVVVNDGSADATAEILEDYRAPGITVVHQPENRGKGAAVRTGVDHATGTHMVILDSDLEYNPRDIPALMEPVVRGEAQHVFGARVFGVNSRFTSLKFAMGGRATTVAANLLYDSCLTDMHTCLKLIPVADFRAMPLRETGFGLDTEITARLLRDGVRPYEVSISYLGRTADQGKKISVGDGLECLKVLLRVRFSKRVSLPVGAIEGAVPVAAGLTALATPDASDPDHSPVGSASSA